MNHYSIDSLPARSALADVPATWLVHRLIGTPYFREILDGSFAAVSTPIFVIKYAFWSAWRDLHIRYYSADFKSQFFVQKFERFLSRFCFFFRKIIEIFRILMFCWQISLLKIGILDKSARNVREFPRFRKFCWIRGRGVRFFVLEITIFQSGGAPGQIQPMHPS